MMSSDEPRYRIGDVGPGARVQQGEYLVDVTLQVQNVADAARVMLELEKQVGRRSYHGPPLRRLDPIVIVNRARELLDVSRFLQASTDSVLWLLGQPAIGKSTLARGALELRRSETPAVWVTCEGLDAEQFLRDVSATLGPEGRAMVDDAATRLVTRIAAVLGAIRRPSIVVLDGFEALLDEQDRIRSREMAEVVEALTTLEHPVKVLVTTRRLPEGVGRGTSGVQILRLRGLDATLAEDLVRMRTGAGRAGSLDARTREALEKLEGHPKFIELFASALAELPADRVVPSLLTASDIGAFVVNEVLGAVSGAELAVLRAALVFRGPFPLEALAAVAGAEVAVDAPLRALVRRALLEPPGGSGVAYYLHPLL